MRPAPDRSLPADESNGPAQPATPLPGGREEDLAQLTYEQARAALDEVVNLLESATVDLAASLALWERGNALADIAQGYLDGARERIRATRPDLLEQAAEA